MTFMDVLRKEEEETVEEGASSSPIHADVWDLFDRFSKKSKAVSQQGLEEADEALEDFIQHTMQGGKLGDTLGITNLFREPFRTGKVNLNAVDASEDARERFVKDIETFSRKAEDIEHVLYGQGAQDEEEIAKKWRELNVFKNVVAKLFGEELVLQTRVRRSMKGEEEYTAVSTKRIPSNKKNGVLEKIISVLRTPASPTLQNMERMIVGLNN